eukprot:CAMPEP_0182418346 /NCGR_PEP_ID=MMETSP1167-20130531/2802_1 /TAXON_ID=2988 /ORGANISM="Mallomonas Sp, Strain CCMP3275" /LENGTH=240 /DNA_ID=CAMNT_0024592511 /DNA_START=191 /DNA_END=913 /DNA_ORIENTATION=-
MEVKLIEVNMSPDISLSTPVTRRLVPPALSDLFDLIMNDRVKEMRCEKEKDIKKVTERDQCSLLHSQINSVPLETAKNTITNTITTTKSEADKDSVFEREVSLCQGEMNKQLDTPGNTEKHTEIETENHVVIKTVKESSAALRWELWYSGEEETIEEIAAQTARKDAQCVLEKDYHPRKLEVMEAVLEMLSDRLDNSHTNISKTHSENIISSIEMDSAQVSTKIESISVTKENEEDEDEI